MVDIAVLWFLSQKDISYSNVCKYYTASNVCKYYTAWDVGFLADRTNCRSYGTSCL